MGAVIGEDWDRSSRKSGYRWRWPDYLAVIIMCGLMTAVLGFAIWRFWP